MAVVANKTSTGNHLYIRDHHPQTIVLNTPIRNVVQILPTALFTRTGLLLVLARSPVVAAAAESVKQNWHPNANQVLHIVLP
jgi:hypothetical protein